MGVQIPLSPQFAANVARWARGEMTWAQVEGFTSTKAREFARAGCDLAKRGQLKKAAVIFEGLVAMNPKDQGSRAALGAVYHRMGRTGDARQLYDEVLAADPKNVLALANRGELRLQGGDRGGMDDLRQAVQADPGMRTASARRAKGLIGASPALGQKRV